MAGMTRDEAILQDRLEPTLIAREMVGFIWSIACTVQSAPKTA